MLRIIPRKTKIKFRFYKDISILDMMLGLLTLVILSLTVTSNLPDKFKISTIILMVVAPMYITFEDERIYRLLFNFIRYLFSAKRLRSKSKNNNIEFIMPYDKIEDNLILNKNGNFVSVIKINPIDIYMMNERKQNYLIDNVLNTALKTLSYFQQANIVKLEQPLILDNYEQEELNKLEVLIGAKEQDLLTEEEYKKRVDIVQDRLEVIKAINKKRKIKHSVFYFCIYDVSKNNLNETSEFITSLLSNNVLNANKLNNDELLNFIAYSFKEDIDYNAETLKAVYPNKLKFGILKTIQDDKRLTQFVINDYPLKVGNAWAEELYNIPNTKVVMKLRPIEKYKAIKRVDNAIAEVSSNNDMGRASASLQKQTHLESLQILLENLQNEDEMFFETTIIVTVYDELKMSTNKKLVQNTLKRLGFRFNEMIAKQMDTYGSNSFSTYNNIKTNRGINSSTVSAGFPFISDSIMDEKGLLIGENSLPVFLDFFKRDNERVNSNMIIIGKSGSGKSYATKNILTHLASENVKAFILDPENEYGTLAQNLGGKVLDVSSSKDGRLNPFHIIQSLDDKNMDGSKNSFYSHLQFLEEFFRLILVGIKNDSLELLHKLILEMYVHRNINAYTDFNKIKAKDYPTFENLIELIKSKIKLEKDEYNMSCLKTLSNYLSKFKKGARNSALWNGHTTFEANENFVCFNFQKLLSNKNSVIANAQMLLILKWLENEVQKNRDYNIKNGANRKIVIAIDEAHVFIDEKHQVALDFMHQLAKRIRKYNGSLIVITQNIKDFVGSPEIERKSSAIINVSQYSLIFNLPPNDMSDLIKLYEKAGQINERESENIISLPRGSAFLIASPSKRTNINIVATPKVLEFFNS